MHFYNNWFPVIGDKEKITLFGKTYDVKLLNQITINKILFVSLKQGISFNRINDIIFNKKVVSCSKGCSSSDLLSNLIQFMNNKSILYNIFNQYGKIKEYRVLMPCIYITYVNKIEATIVFHTTYTVQILFKYKKKTFQDSLHIIVPINKNKSNLVSLVDCNMNFKFIDKKIINNNYIIHSYFDLLNDIRELEGEGIEVVSLFLDACNK